MISRTRLDSDVGDYHRKMEVAEVAVIELNDYEAIIELSAFRLAEQIGYEEACGFLDDLSGDLFKKVT